MADRAMAQVSTDSRWTSDGYYFRDINPNPNGFAMHCGLPMAKTVLVDSWVRVDVSNVAHGKSAAQSPIWSGGY